MRDLPFGEKPLAQFTTRYERLRLWPDAIERVSVYAFSNREPELRPLVSVLAKVEDGLKRRRRFAPQDGTLTISGPGFEWPLAIEPRDASMARVFAARLNATASELREPAAPTGDDVVSKLAQLARMHETGTLSYDEFAAAKTRLLFGDGEGGEQGAFV